MPCLITGVLLPLSWTLHHPPWRKTEKVHLMQQPCLFKKSTSLMTSISEGELYLPAVSFTDISMSPIVKVRWLRFFLKCSPQRPKRYTRQWIDKPSDFLITSLTRGFRVTVLLSSRLQLGPLLTATAFSVSLQFPIHHFFRSYLGVPVRWHLKESRTSSYMTSQWTDPRASNRSTVVEDIHRFWSPHSLETYLSVTSECRVSLIWTFFLVTITE